MKRIQRGQIGAGVTDKNIKNLTLIKSIDIGSYSDTLYCDFCTIICAQCLFQILSILPYLFYYAMYSTMHIIFYA